VNLPPTLFLTVAGSHAHGTARASSDVDLRGLCRVPLDRRLSLFESFEQHEGEVPVELSDRVWPALQAHPSASRSLQVGVECVLFDVVKFFRLCVAANPNALEILFADPADWLLSTPTWLGLHAQRHLFLTQRVHQTFLGYGMAQLKRIRTHRSWLLSPPSRRPSRAEFGLPDASTLSRNDQHRIDRAIAERVRSYGVDEVEMPGVARVEVRERLEAFHADLLGVEPPDVHQGLEVLAGKALQLPPEVIATLSAERRYRSAMRQWSAYQSWKTHRNPARAALEKKHGYDTKHAAHLVRLMRMGQEALAEGEVRVRRPDADELAAIRDGALTYDELLVRTEALRSRVVEAAAGSRLPKKVVEAQVDALLYDLLV